MSEFMTRKEACDALGMSLERIRQLAAKGNRYPNRVGFLHEIKVGNRCMITRQSVNKRQDILALLAEKIAHSPDGLTKPECAHLLGLHFVEIAHLLRALSDKGTIYKKGKRDVPNYGIEQIWVAAK